MRFRGKLELEDKRGHDGGDLGRELSDEGPGREVHRAHQLHRDTREVSSHAQPVAQRLDRHLGHAATLAQVASVLVDLGEPLLRDALRRLGDLQGAWLPANPHEARRVQREAATEEVTLPRHWRRLHALLDCSICVAGRLQLDVIG